MLVIFASFRLEVSETEFNESIGIFSFALTTQGFGALYKHWDIFRS